MEAPPDNTAGARIPELRERENRKYPLIAEAISSLASVRADLAYMVEDPGYPTGDVFDQYHVEAEITFLQTFLERGSWYPDGWEHVTHVPLGLRDPDFSLEFQNLLGLSGEEAEQWSERAREVLEKTWFNGVLYLDDEEKEFLKSVEDFLVRAQEEANRFTVPSI